MLCRTRSGGVTKQRTGLTQALLPQALRIPTASIELVRMVLVASTLFYPKYSSKPAKPPTLSIELGHAVYYPGTHQKVMCDTASATKQPFVLCISRGEDAETNAERGWRRPVPCGCCNTGGQKKAPNLRYLRSVRALAARVTHIAPRRSHADTVADNTWWGV